MMPFDDALIHAAASRIHQSERVLVVTHIRPDGDAVGSLIGLGLALEQAGLDIQLVIDDGVPASMRHLEGYTRIQQKPKHDADLVITVDCSDLERTGTVFKNRAGPDINIDHHITNTLFAKINLVDDKASATSEIITAILPQFGIRLTPAISAALLTGLITDTIGFRTSNVRPKTLLLAAQLMETGINMSDLYQRALINRSFEAVKIWGYGLSKIEKEGGLVWTTLTIKDRKQAGYSGRDDADLINVLSSVEGVDIAIVFVEQPNGNIKISWRSQPGFDVAGLAAEFGGGGHPAASGAEISGTLGGVKTAILEKTRNLIIGGYRVEEQ
jgi:bifunctional oligoribonuclease and PAP phosphatase NrnA